MLNLRLAPLFGLLLAAGATLASARAQEAKKDEKKEPPKAVEASKGATAASPDGKVDFLWKLEKDKPFYQDITTDTTQGIKVMNLDVNQTQSQTFWLKWTPLKEDAKKWTVKETIEGLKMKIDIAGNPIAFDSETAAPQGSNNQLYDFFKSLKGSEFTLTLSDKFKVEKIEGKDEFLKKLGAANQQMESLLKTILTDEALKQMADPTFGFVPPEPKKIGESWTVTSTVNLGPIGTYENKYTYTFKSRDGDLCNVDVVTEIGYKAPTDNGAGLPFKIKASDLRTKDKTPGKMVYNVKTGRVESAELTLKIGGNMSVEIGGTTTNVELTQEQKTTVKTSDIKSYLPEKK